MRPKLLRALLWALGLTIVVVAGFTIVEQWSSVRTAARDVHPDWSMVAASGALVLVGYAVLIETWRRVVAALGSALSVRAAARIWLVSSLARYIPGAAWQMGAMGLMAKQEPGVSAVVATSSAVLMTLVNVVTGLALVAAGGAGRLDIPMASASLAAMLIVGFALAPRVVAPLLRLIARLTGKTIELPALTWRALLLAAAGTTLGWLLYGVAFELLARAILGETREGTMAYIAAYTGAYLAGFLSLGPPAGLGVADGALITLLTKFRLADVGGASVLAVAARLWRTVLEVAPGIMVLAYSATRRDSRLSNDAQ